MRERIEWIDVTKGIGIVLVIYGHLFTNGSNLFTWIFAFHMPLFFFCSGLVFREYDNFLDMLVKKVKSILIPYFIFLFIGFVVSMLIPKWRVQYTYEQIMYYLYIGQPECFHVGQIWFLVCLFFVEIMFYGAYILLKNRNKFMWFFFILFISFVSQQMLQFLNVWDIGRLPLKIDTAFTALIFYCLGYLFALNNCKEEFKNKRRNIVYLFVLCFISLLSKINGTVNIIGIYGDFFLFIFFAIIGILLIIIISYTIGSCPFLRYIGRHSLVIFALHSFGEYAYAALLSCIRGEEKEIMVNLSLGEVFIGGILVTISMTLVCFIIDKIKMQMKNSKLNG